MCLKKYVPVRGCVSLKKKESQGKAAEVTVNSKFLKTFIWILTKNSATGSGGRDERSAAARLAVRQ
jgi:hypothetical protein